MTRLAKDYGMSGGALAKTCRRLGVPVPPPGYWAKLQHGKTVAPRPTLPPDAEDRPAAATIARSQPGRTPNLLDPLVDTCFRPSDETAGCVRVAEQLRNPHPAVKSPPAGPGAPPRGGAGSGAPRVLPMNVSHASRARALRILDALAKSLEARGFKVTAAGAHIEGEVVPIAMSEKQDRAPHVATANELARQKAYSWEKIPAWDYAANGLLSIHSECYVHWRPDLRKRWSDRRAAPLEDRLDDVLLGLVSLGVELRKRTEERRAEQERWAEQQRQRAERERQARMEAARAKDVLDSARSFSDAELVRRLIAAVRRQAVLEGGTPPEGLESWLERAGAVAAGLDPMSGGLDPLLARHEEAALKGGEERAAPRWGERG